MSNNVDEVVRDPQRLQALRTTGLLDTDAEEAFDRLTRMATRVLDVPLAFVSLVDEDRQFLKSCAGIEVSDEADRELPLSHSFCKHSVTAGEPVIIDDAASDPRVAENPGREAYEIGSYVGIPLNTSNGHALGTFCAIAHEPRRWTDDDVQLLEDLAASVITEIELRADIRKRRQLEEKLKYQTMHDALTDLANRKLFWDRLEHATERARRSGSLLGVLALDLDGFKKINDTYGHLAGDNILCEVADRLNQRLRRADTLARFGGDEFMALLEDIGGHQALREIIERLEATLGAPIENDSYSVSPSISIGSIVFRPAGAAEDYPKMTDPEAIIGAADDAMYAAKSDDRTHRASQPPE